jgi:hypothetical protein
MSSRKEGKMKNISIIAVVAWLLVSMTAYAEKTRIQPAMNKIEPLPQDLEIQLALSALPPHLRDNATVYVFNPDKGFEVSRKGSNGFHTLVGRVDESFFRGDWPLTEYRDDILIPISFDEAGAKAQMQVMLDVAEMLVKGKSPDELRKIINDRYQSGHYRAPSRTGISYMLSPILRTYENPDESDKVGTFNMPHVMFYAPNVTNEDIGGKLQSEYPFVIVPGPHGYIIQALGQAEKAKINQEYEAMLNRLCGIKEEWCLHTATDLH